MCRVNEPAGACAPRFFFARSADANLWRCRDDLPEATVLTLERLAADEPVRGELRGEPTHLEAFRAALDVQTASFSSGPAYRFPDELPPVGVPVTRVQRSDLPLLRLLPWDLDETARTFESFEPLVAMIEQGHAVSLCHSARLTDRAAEAGIETLAAYRRRGHATAVVAGWALAVRATGRIPLYSTSWQNLASQALAGKLGLIQYGTTLSLP
jgi:hypothetical protein